jgi:hypothetical protein
MYHGKGESVNLVAALQHCPSRPISDPESCSRSLISLATAEPFDPKAGNPCRHDKTCEGERGHIQDLFAVKIDGTLPKNEHAPKE